MENNITQEQFLEHIDTKAALILSAVDPNVDGSYTFANDLKYGKAGEIFVKNFFVHMGFTFVKFNNDNKYDFLGSSKKGENVKVEVKTDSYVGNPERDRGNWAIELESRGKESGINVTTADWWALYAPKKEEIWLIKTENLVKLIKDNNFRIAEFGGDKGSNTKNHLLPRAEVQQHFTKYDVSSNPPVKI